MTEHDCTRTEYPMTIVYTRPGDPIFKTDGDNTLVPHGKSYIVSPTEVFSDLWRRANQSVFWTILERMGLR